MSNKTGDIYLNSTLAFCPHCHVPELAMIIARESGVFMERLCPKKGKESIKIVSDYKWYVKNLSTPRKVKKQTNPMPLSKGCPLDCGLCECHTGSIHLPVFSITNDCNLDCNICFTYNRPDKKYFKSIEDTKKIIKNIIESTDGVDLINLTGGEPTLHPGLFEVLEACRSEKIGRITMNTNGIRIAEDYSFAEKIKDSGVQLVLSLNTFDPQKSTIIHGKDITRQKRLALETLESLDIPTTILSVCIKGVNEEDVSYIAHEYFTKNFVRSITIQNMTFTGKRGSRFHPREHITIDEVESLLAGNEEFSQEDFFPLGSYHPLCYSAAYYIVHKGNIFPLTKLIDRELLMRFTENSYLLDSSSDFSTYLHNGIDRLWAEGEDEGFLNFLRRLLLELYPRDKVISPQERRNLAEKFIKMIYIHPHMDEDNFDITRVSCCGDIVPDESGKMIPACTYNLLYRQLDSRFWMEGLSC